MLRKQANMIEESDDSANLCSITSVGIVEVAGLNPAPSTATWILYFW